MNDDTLIVDNMSPNILEASASKEYVKNLFKDFNNESDKKEDTKAVRTNSD